MWSVIRAQIHFIHHTYARVLLIHQLWISQIPIFTEIELNIYGCSKWLTQIIIGVDCVQGDDIDQMNIFRRNWMIEWRTFLLRYLSNVSLISTLAGAVCSAHLTLHCHWKFIVKTYIEPEILQNNILFCGPPLLHIALPPRDYMCTLSF